MKANFLSLFYLLFASSLVFASDDAFVPTVSTISELAKEVISKKIEADSNAKVTITPQNLDDRLNPPRCFPPLEVELATDREISRNNTVKISCNSPDFDYPWQMFLSVRVSIEYPVVVSSSILSKGDLITAEHVEVKYVDQYSLRGQTFTDTNELIGTRSKRRVGKDMPILSSHLCFVCKGDAVSIFAKTETFIIKTIGESLRDGNLGDVIRVKNTNSNRQLDAIVIGVGEVEVKM